MVAVSRSTLYLMLLLIVMLWLLGATAWIAAFESRTDRRLTLRGQMLVLLLWPLFGIIAAAEHLFAVLRGQG